MIRPILSAFAALALSASAVAEAAQATGAPMVINPALNDPWLVQLKPGLRQPLFTYPPAGRQPARFSAPATGQPTGRSRQIDPRYLPATVSYPTDERSGTVVIDTNARYLYLILGNGQAMRYGVGVGRPGFEWAGEHRVTRKAEWPDWTPPAEMLQRQPGLPRHMEGGPNNPLGARALYLGSTLYRIHGSNEPWTIGHAVSSGCIRMRNEDVIELYSRVGVGTKVIVI
jgi:lipoprotein-anchoring transpeptidase ErfK/SrfK